MKQTFRRDEKTKLFGDSTTRLRCFLVSQNKNVSEKMKKKLKYYKYLYCIVLRVQYVYKYSNKK